MEKFGCKRRLNLRSEDNVLREKNRIEVNRIELNRYFCGMEAYCLSPHPLPPSTLNVPNIQIVLIYKHCGLHPTAHRLTTQEYQDESKEEKKHRAPVTSTTQRLFLNQQVGLSSAKDEDYMFCV